MSDRPESVEVFFDQASRESALIPGAVRDRLTIASASEGVKPDVQGEP